MAVVLEDGSMLRTLENREGAVVMDADGAQIARNEKCPGVHGEAVVGEVVVVGCEDGVLLFDDGEFTKVASPDGYGRIGNQAASDASRVLLGDYKTDPDAELERPTQVSLVDTRSGELSLLDLETSYSFRSLGRGPEGEALVLGTDGALKIIDPEKQKVVASVPVVAKWEEPVEWQQPRPTLTVVGDLAWISDPAAKRLHAVDLTSQEVVNTLEIDHAPNELVGVTG
ncbi:hypothetical protein [Nocardioides alcanivorans]|uniref:hypothetical protein n=1 Tax=Nocardioides alcanivorans TaxID=2897352 RepID=UPI001F32A1AC|nr:hypothetical protein [Nocardioides alcanivorans]